MSFSAKVKEELVKKNGTARHCQIAELSALIYMCGYMVPCREGGMGLCVQTENEAVSQKCFTLLEKNFKISLKYQRKTPI